MARTIVDIDIPARPIRDAFHTAWDLFDDLADRVSFLSFTASYCSLISVTVARAQFGEVFDLMKSRNLHHVNVHVSDVARSEAFYQKLFGFSPTRRVQGPDNHGFDLPGGGLIILQKSDQPGRLDHFCVGVDNFDAERLRTAVKTAGIEGVQGGASDNFFVSDPDGLRVQVSAFDWRA